VTNCAAAWTPASFADMVALKGKSDIGDQINKRIVRPLEEANHLRIKADFNDDALEARVAGHLAQMGFGSV